MQRIRAARAIADYYKKMDPYTSISEAFIRKLMMNGEIPTFRNGVKRLTSIEAVDEYLKKALATDPATEN